MAIDAVVYSSSQVQVGVAQEGTFGTATADAGAFVHIVEFDSVSIDYGLIKDINVKNRAQRVPYDSDAYVSETGGLRTITVSGIIVRKTDAGEFLYAVSQNVSEGASTPYAKIFTLNGQQPDFASDAGYFCTVGIKMPGSSDDLKFTSCIVSEVSMSADCVGGDGRLKMDVTFISGFSSAVTSTFSGTWTAASQEYFDFNAPTTKTIESNDVVLYGFDLTITNNAKRVGVDSSGDCETYSVHIPALDVKGNVNIKYDSNTLGFLADSIAGTDREIHLATGTDAVDGNFDIRLFGCLFDDFQHDKKDQGLAVSLPFTCVYDGSNHNYVRVCDAVDQTW